MAKIIVQPGHNLRALAAHAGSNLQQLRFRPNEQELEVEDVTQPALDTALVDYTANQATIDAAFQATEDDAETLKVQDSFDADELRILRALVTLIMKELNILRANDGLPDRTFAQLRTALRNEIANP